LSGTQEIQRMSDWEPCRFIDYEDGTLGLLFDDFGPTESYLEERGFMAGGYTWHGIVEALVRVNYPDLVADLEYAPEGSMLAVRSANKQALKRVADLIRQAQQNQQVLRQGIDNADPSIIE
jgi:hypothetical protein